MWWISAVDIYLQLGKSLPHREVQPRDASKKLCDLVDSKCIDYVLECSTGIWGFNHLVQDIEGSLCVGLAQVLGGFHSMAAHHELVDLEEGENGWEYELMTRVLWEEAMKMWNSEESIYRVSNENENQWEE